MSAFAASRRLRVTFVLPGYPWRPVGGFRVVYEYANQLADRGHDVTVVHPRRCGVPRSERLPASSSARRAASEARGWARSLVSRPVVNWHPIAPSVKMLAVPNLSRHHMPAGDVIVATAWRTARPVLAAGPESGEKFYLIQHHETWDGAREAVDATWLFPLRKIVIARWLERTGREFGVPPQEMRYIPNGIDQTTYKMERPFSERPRRVAALCHDLPWKGSRDAVSALEIVRQSVPDLQAVMFGTMARPSWVPQWIEYRQDPDQNDLVAKIYNGSAIYLCASWSEGWHLPPAEAMACGCALVSTDIDGVADYAVNGVTALLGRPQAPESLAQQMLAFLRDDELRISIAKAGRKQLEEFTWARATDLLEEWFLECSEEIGLAG